MNKLELKNIESVVQNNGYDIEVELYLNNKTIFRQIWKEEVAEEINLTLDLGEGDSLHYSEFTDGDWEYLEIDEEDILIYLNKNLEETEIIGYL
tara:strand:- start:338 stop:619 length:282 start_codon:yes stop_codon:yes gene_type:complete